MLYTKYQGFNIVAAQLLWLCKWAPEIQFYYTCTLLLFPPVREMCMCVLVQLMWTVCAYIKVVSGTESRIWNRLKGRGVSCLFVLDCSHSPDQPREETGPLC